MARKPLDQLSPAYRRRIERGEARGLTRQQARGQGREAVLSAIRRQAKLAENFSKDGKSYEEIREEMKEWVDRNGFDLFQKMLNIQRTMKKEYRGRAKNGFVSMTSEQFADYLDQEFDGDPPELEWIYYH